MSPSELGYDRNGTALLLIDPYNDFLSEGGKLWPMVEQVAREVGVVENLRILVHAARSRGIRIFVVPHRRWEPGDYLDWDHPTPYQLAAGEAQVFEKGSWGGAWHPDFVPQPGDVVVKEHWGGSGFANTDLDFRLKQNRITRVVVVGLLANTCVETTSRFAAELGYHVTLIRDATAAFGHDRMHAAHELNGPTYAHEILTTEQVVGAFQPTVPAAPSTT
jgi:nicotinamidase-related amidase